MNDDKISKFGVWCVFFLVFFVLGFKLIYVGTYNLVNKVDSGMFYMNATDNKFATDIYFSTEEVEETHFFLDLCENIEGLDEVVDQCSHEANNHELWHFFEQQQKEIIDIASTNEKYMEYLEKKGCSLEDLASYINKMAHVDDFIIQVAIYFTVILICLVTIWIFKARKEFYIVAAIVYLIAMASVFSDGLTDYFVSIVISFIAKINKVSFSYVDMELVNTYFLNAVKEALMTVVIFDTIFEFRNSRNQTQLQRDVRYVFETMSIQISYMLEHVDSEFKFVGRIEIPAYNLEKLCKKETKKMRRALKRQKVKNRYYYKYKSIYEINCELLDLLIFLRTNSERMCTCKEYIDDMIRVKELMIAGGYTRI